MDTTGCIAMSQTLFEPALQTEPIDAVPRPRHWTRWPQYILLLVVFLWVVDVGFSLLIRHTRLQKKLTARLESVFGRSVEVGRYDFSLWGGPALQAQSVTFSDDPRFGYEYFLRAESLTVRLRWQSLFRGHLQLGTISLVNPSVNLVRNANGDWNVAEWLPKPNGAASSGPSPTHPAVRFGRIEVDSGRINFKRVSEKLPFALVNVNGYLEPDGQGRWTMNLEAVPTRAAVVLQQAGTIYVSGRVGGTSSRLRPAVLDLAWGNASLSDVLRLARGYDFGVRGNLAVAMHADTESDNWILQMHAELRQLHRWDLALRPDNPALNLNAKMTLYPLGSGLDVSEATLEAPHSWARLRARFSWQTPTGFQSPSKGQIASPDQIEITRVAGGAQRRSHLDSRISFRCRKRCVAPRLGQRACGSLRLAAAFDFSGRCNFQRGPHEHSAARACAPRADTIPLRPRNIHTLALDGVLWSFGRLAPFRNHRARGIARISHLSCVGQPRASSRSRGYRWCAGMEYFARLGPRRPDPLRPALARRNLPLANAASWHDRMGRGIDRRFASYTISESACQANQGARRFETRPAPHRPNFCRRVWRSVDSALSIVTTMTPDGSSRWRRTTSRLLTWIAGSIRAGARAFSIACCRS